MSGSQNKTFILPLKEDTGLDSVSVVQATMENQKIWTRNGVKVRVILRIPFVHTCTMFVQHKTTSLRTSNSEPVPRYARSPPTGRVRRNLNNTLCGCEAGSNSSMDSSMISITKSPSRQVYLRFKFFFKVQGLIVFILKSCFTVQVSCIYSSIPGMFYCTMITKLLLL